jgi:hypothetical protein
MRSLQRSWREIHYAAPIGVEPILDEYGNDTLEVRQIYGDQAKLPVNISANAGQDAVNTFGSQTEYSRTISYVGLNCPLVEGARVWFGIPASDPHNYLVVKVADSKNGYLIALREVAKLG